MKLKEGLQPIIINPLNASACLMLYIDVDIDVDIDMYVDRDGDIECIMMNNRIENNRKYCIFLTSLSGTYTTLMSVTQLLQARMLIHPEICVVFSKNTKIKFFVNMCYKL